MGIFICWDLQNGINIIQFGEFLLCAGTAEIDIFIDFIAVTIQSKLS